MLIKQVSQKSAIFVTIGIFLSKGFKFQPNFCNRCHDSLMMSMKLSDIAALNIKDSDYHCIISGITKKGGHKLSAKYRFGQKSGTL